MAGNSGPGDQAGDIAQLVDYAACTKPWVQSSALLKVDMVVHVCNLCIWEVETRIQSSMSS